MITAKSSFQPVFTYYPSGANLPSGDVTPEPQLDIWLPGTGIIDYISKTKGWLGKHAMAQALASQESIDDVRAAAVDTLMEFFPKLNENEITLPFTETTTILNKIRGGYVLAHHETGVELELVGQDDGTGKPGTIRRLIGTALSPDEASKVSVLTDVGHRNVPFVRTITQAVRNGYIDFAARHGVPSQDGSDIDWCRSFGIKNSDHTYYMMVPPFNVHDNVGIPAAQEAAQQL